MKKYIVPTLVLSLFLLGISASYALNDKLSVANAPNLDVLKASIPTTFQDTQAKILPIQTRYLMYTYDGRHIMWGSFGRGYFTGTDDQGKHAWGIYSNGIFAGFYDNEFFWGKYSNGDWKALGLFHLQYSNGKYILFPTILPAVAEAIPKMQ
jgi:hypothetical protein